MPKNIKFKDAVNNLKKRFPESKIQANQSFFEMVDELREYNKDVPFEQIERDVVQAVVEIRQEKYGKKQYIQT